MADQASKTAAAPGPVAAAPGDTEGMEAAVAGIDLGATDDPEAQEDMDANHSVQDTTE